MRVVKVMPKDSTELSDILVEEDPLYGGIFIAQEHLDAWQKEFNTEHKAEDSLVEEMAELIQAINKQRRNNTKKSQDAIREEMAHVLISLKGLCRYKMITPGEIEKEIQAKWPAAYEPKKGECKDCYWSVKTQHNDVVTVLRCVARCNTACDYCGPCGGFAKKEEK